MVDPDAPRVGSPWSIAEEKILYEGFSGLGDIDRLARQLGRKAGGVSSRLKLLGLVEFDAAGLLIVSSPKPEFKPIATLSDPGARQEKQERVRLKRPEMASLNMSEQYCVHMFRKIPRERRKELFLVMRILATAGSIDETDPPPDDDADPAKHYESGPY
ncbi:hypothetical protein [Acidiphilium sp.]|uniref:hypothetical protein n=1 Tax=Acidiphilium sp. TaxID=527 RepID=UPI003D095734